MKFRYGNSLFLLMNGEQLRADLLNFPAFGNTASERDNYG